MTQLVGKLSTNEIKNWYLSEVTDRTVVEISTDSGQTWVAFRKGNQLTEDVIRLSTMLRRGYWIRARRIEKVKVTQEQVEVTNSFFRSIEKANATESNVVKHSKDLVGVFRTDGGGYWFTAKALEGEFLARHPDGELACVVQRTTYYDSVTPNENEINRIKNHSDAKRLDGYVFRLMKAAEDRHIAHWWPVLEASNNKFDRTYWTSVRCARHYDYTLDEIFKDLGQIIAVISGKWVWGWNKRFKLGDTWIIPSDKSDMLVKRLIANGMAIEPQDTSPPPTTPVNFNANEVDPRYIMGIRIQLEELIKTGDKLAIIDAVLKVIEFRNKCVDELKELNKTIEVAREVIQN